MGLGRADRFSWAAGCALVFAGAVWAGQAQASEGGASVYLLGSGGPEAAVSPPLPGVFLANTIYRYSASATAEKQFVVGGNLVAGLDATVTAHFGTVLWVPTTDFAGGTLALGAVLPVGEPSVDVSAVIVGPRGNQVSLAKSDSAFVVGDPLAMASLGWKRGNASIQSAILVNIPIGDYREGELANLAFHRWAVDTSLAATWHDEASGWDLSGKAGFTFNGENPVTDYDTGTEFHLEGSIEKTLSPKVSLGLQAYHFEQVTGDSGPGATLGSFKGRITGVGATAAYRFKLGKRPATLRLHAMTEFDAKNRLEGDAIWLDFTLPLFVKLPRAAPAR